MRMGMTLFLIGLLYVVVVGLLLALGVGWFFAMVIAVGGLVAQWYFSDRMALFGMKARVVTPEQAPQLHAIVDRLCAMADISASVMKPWSAGCSAIRGSACISE